VDALPVAISPKVNGAYTYDEAVVSQTLSRGLWTIPHENIGQFLPVNQLLDAYPFYEHSQRWKFQIKMDIQFEGSTFHIKWTL